MAMSAETLVLAVQSSGIVDHVCFVEREFVARAAGEPGGSRRVSFEELESLLADGGVQFRSSAGGSAANTPRGLADGFGFRCGVVGAVGADVWGVLYSAALQRARVDTTRLLVQQGRPTARCAVLVDAEGQRTMRTALTGAAALQPGDLRADSFAGSQWVSVAAYALYQPGLLPTVAACAQLNNARVALHLASFEVVRAHRDVLRQLLQAGCVQLCFANEDEACEFAADADGARGSVEDALELLSSLCGVAVITLGAHGCIAKRAGEAAVRQEAVSGVECVDSTAAGDYFASGFLAGMVGGAPLSHCAKLGVLAGAAAVRVVGADVPHEAWAWAREQLASLDLEGGAVPASQSDSCPHWAD